MLEPCLCGLVTQEHSVKIGRPQPSPMTPSVSHKVVSPMPPSPGAALSGAQRLPGGQSTAILLCEDLTMCWWWMQCPFSYLMVNGVECSRECVCHHSSTQWISMYSLMSDRQDYTFFPITNCIPFWIFVKGIFVSWIVTLSRRYTMTRDCNHYN